MTRRFIHSVFLCAGLTSLGATVSGCNGPRVINEAPVLVTGERVPEASRAAQSSIAAGVAARDAQRLAAESTFTSALASCGGDTCSALARGEVSLGMTESQVLAASRSTSDAWSARRGAQAVVLVPATLAAPPSDAIGELAMVQITGGRVSTITYRERAGYHTITRPTDATAEGRAAATGRMLVAEGDQLVAAGDKVSALDRYDRALALLPNDAMLQYRVATMLELQLRPIEALMRYQRFLQTLELQRIEAQGNADAKLADAIARARERIIVLEKQSR